MVNLQMSFSRDIADNLIEKHKMSAPATYIHAVKAAADGEDPP
jgi:hypothetical protein